MASIAIVEQFKIAIFHHRLDLGAGLCFATVAWLSILSISRIYNKGKRKKDDSACGHYKLKKMFMHSLSLDSS